MEIFPLIGFESHYSLCKKIKENKSVVQRKYLNLSPLRQLKKEYGNRVVKECVKGLTRDKLKYKQSCVRKHSKESREKISRGLKKAHADDRANKWKFKESYAEKFFNEYFLNSGYKLNIDFIREKPFSPFRADFFFIKKNLVVEIDGIQHLRYRHQTEIDCRKNIFLNCSGIAVIRIIWLVFFKNTKEMLNNLKNILEENDFIIRKNKIDLFHKFQESFIKSLDLVYLNYDVVSIYFRSLFEDIKNPLFFKDLIYKFEKKKMDIINREKRRKEKKNICLSIQELKNDLFNFPLKITAKKYKIGKQSLINFCIENNIERPTKKFWVDKNRQKQRKLFLSKEELTKLVFEIPLSKIAKIYRVSDKAVKKLCEKLGIKTYPLGYWAKKYAGKL
jgi:very-short-patch-repair endonuclease